MRQIIIILSIGFLSADYGGGYAGSGFRYGTNAREFSLAGALVADKTPGFYAFSNPALLQFARSSQIGLSLQSMSLDRYIQTFSYVKNLPPKAGVGLAILRSGTDNIQGRNTMNQETEMFSASEIEGILSFGVALGSKLSLGINIKAAFTTIADDYKGNGISGDLGVLFKINRRLLLGGVIKNLSGGYNWKVTIGDDERNYEEKFPQTIVVGATYSGFKGISIFFQEDMVSIPGQYINYRSRLGMEYHLSNGVELRGGLKQARGVVPSGSELRSSNFKPAIGVGVPLKIWKRQHLKMDYAFDPGSVGEGVSHLFSFSIKFMPYRERRRQGTRLPELENKYQSETNEDLLILQRTIEILSDKSKWNSNDVGICKAEDTTWSLSCALHKASLEIAGEFQHGRVALIEVRRMIHKLMKGEKFEHILMNFNNTREFEDIQKVLNGAMEQLKKRLNN